jgi:hypothetical protein
MMQQSVYISVEMATVIATRIQFHIKHDIAEHYIEVPVRDENGGMHAFLLRPILEQDLLPLVDKKNVVKCIANDGLRIDIWLPPPTQWPTTPATLHVESQA